MDEFERYSLSLFEKKSAMEVSYFMTTLEEQQRRLYNRASRELLSRRAADYHRQKYMIHRNRAQVASPFTSWLHRLRSQRSLVKSRLHGIQERRYGRGARKFQMLKDIGDRQRQLEKTRADLRRNRALYSQGQGMTPANVARNRQLISQGKRVPPPAPPLPARR